MSGSQITKRDNKFPEPYCIEKHILVLETILPHNIKKIYKLNKDVPLVFLLGV